MFRLPERLLPNRAAKTGVWAALVASTFLIVFQLVAWYTDNIPAHILPGVRLFSGTQECIPLAYAWTARLGILSMAGFYSSLLVVALHHRKDALPWRLFRVAGTTLQIVLAALLVWTVVLLVFDSEDRFDRHRVILGIATVALLLIPAIFLGSARQLSLGGILFPPILILLWLATLLRPVF